jgi:hypothetical protein
VEHKTSTFTIGGPRLSVPSPPLDHLKALRHFCFVFSGETKKVAYEGKTLVAEQFKRRRLTPLVV